MRSRSLGKPFKTWCVSDIRFQNFNDLILFESYEMKRKKIKLLISSDEDGDMGTFIQSLHIQEGPGSGNRAWNFNIFNDATILEYIESHPKDQKSDA